MAQYIENKMITDGRYDQSLAVKTSEVSELIVPSTVGPVNGEEDEAAGEGFAHGADAGASGAGEGAAEVVGEVLVEGRDGEEQLEVLAVGERVGERVGRGLARGRERDGGGVEVEPDAGLAREVPELGGEAVRDVDARAPPAGAEPRALAEARLEVEVAAALE